MMSLSKQAILTLYSGLQMILHFYSLKCMGGLGWHLGQFSIP